MAVVSISRIQIRRGKKNSGTGLPQLASGELGWAIDTQELYIGNGSVAEGAPAVGNTQILTENTDIFDVLPNYTYRKGDTLATAERTIQERLDDRVSIRSYGANGDGTDQTINIQSALNGLYTIVPNSESSRVVLYIEPGVYEISSTLIIPSFATLVGAGADKTIFVQTTDAPLFSTDDSASTSFDTQPRNIHISGMTLQTQAANNKVVELNSCRNSYFGNLRIVGPWMLGDAIQSNAIGIQQNSYSQIVQTKDNLFENIVFEHLGHAVESNFDSDQNIYRNCRFKTLGYGIVFGSTMSTLQGLAGHINGPSYNLIEDSVFDLIENEAIWIEFGIRNISQNNRFLSVGNDGGDASNATTGIVKFGNSTNTSISDYFQRNEQLSHGADFINTAPFLADIDGPAFYEEGFAQRIQLGTNNTPVRQFRLPGDRSRTIKVNYVYTSTSFDFIRSGYLEIVFDKSNNSVTLVEDYRTLGAAESALAENIEFSALYRADIETIDIFSANPSDTGELFIKSEYKS